MKLPFKEIPIGELFIRVGDDVIMKSLLRCRQDLHEKGIYFAVTYMSYKTVVFTRVSSRNEAFTECRPKRNSKPRFMGVYGDWSFGQLQVGQQLEFDVTFNPNEVAVIDKKARSYGWTRGWGIDAFTSEKPNGQRVITIRRVS